MNVARALEAILIAPVLLAVATGVLPAGEAEDLLRRSDAGVLAPPEFRARLAVEGPPAKRRHEIEVWRSGDSMLVRFLDAKERGKFVVQHEGEQWLIAPGAKKPVRLKTSYRLYGGVTLEQIFSVPLERTYTIESAARESGAGGDRGRLRAAREIARHALSERALRRARGGQAAGRARSTDCAAAAKRSRSSSSIGPSAVPPTRDG